MLIHLISNKVYQPRCMVQTSGSPSTLYCSVKFSNSILLRSYDLIFKYLGPAELLALFWKLYSRNGSLTTCDPSLAPAATPVLLFRVLRDYKLLSRITLQTFRTLPVNSETLISSKPSRLFSLSHSSASWFITSLFPNSVLLTTRLYDSKVLMYGSISAPLENCDFI